MKQRKDDLSAFQEWCCLTKQISTRTSAVYASNVRKVLAQVNELTNTDQLDAFMNSESHSKQMRSNFMTSWKAFVEFAKQKSNIELAMPTPKVIQSKRTYTLPGNVLNAYGEIFKFNKMKIADFSAMTRADFKLPPRGSMYEMRHPKRTWEITMIPKVHLDVIFQWGNPIEEPTIPVFPVEPMSTDAIPGAALKQIWRDYTR